MSAARTSRKAGRHTGNAGAVALFLCQGGRAPRVILGLVVVLAMAVIAPAAHAETTLDTLATAPSPRCAQTGAETVATGQDRYPTFATVDIKGTGYGPNCEVTVKVTRADGTVVAGDGTNMPGSDTVKTDAQGNFAYDYQLNDITGTYEVQVLGEGDALLASTQFDDAASVSELYKNGGDQGEIFTAGDELTSNAMVDPSTTPTGSSGANANYTKRYWKHFILDSSGTKRNNAVCTEIPYGTSQVFVGAATTHTFASDDPVSTTSYTFRLKQYSAASTSETTADSTAKSRCEGDTNGTATGGSTEISVDNEPFYVAKLKTYATSGLTQEKSTFKSGDTAFTKVEGMPINGTDWSVSWLRPDGATACANTDGQDRPESSASGLLPEASPNWLQYAPSAGTGTHWNLQSNYDGSCPAFSSSNQGLWKLALQRNVGGRALSVTLPAFTVQAKQSQSITFAQPADKTYGDADFDPGAKASSNLPVSYESSTTDVCTIVSGKVHLKAAGDPCTITAKQAGNDNYDAAQDVTRSFKVNKKNLTGSFTADNKPYDGNRDATVASKSLPGVIGTEDVTLKVTDPKFDTKNVGTNKDVVGSLSLEGADAGNYTVNSSHTAKADITAKQLTVKGAKANDKVYDGNDGATVDFSNASLDGVVGNDSVTLKHSGYSAHFDNKNVGNDKPVTVTGIDRDGTDKGNYTVAELSGLTANITPAELKLDADNKSKPYGDDDPALTYTLSGFKGSDTKDNSGITGTASCSRQSGEDVGTYDITCDPRDADQGGLKAQNYTFATGQKGTFTITKIATNLTLSTPSTTQYSDKVDLTATLKRGTAPLAGKTVKFNVGPTSPSGQAQETEATTDSNGVASTTLKINQDAGSPGVKASYAGDSNLGYSSDTKPFTVAKEDARANYTGSLFTSTSSATSSTGKVSLAATVRDITAVTGDPAYDSDEGDIRNAKVTFVNADNGAALSTGCTNLPVGLVSSSDTKTGTSTCDWTADIGTADSKQFTIGIKVTGPRYDRYSSTDHAVVTVSKPINSMITGGGFLVNQSSAGQMAGATGQRTNFGFNVKYNNAKTNLQGNINTIVRNGSKVYQIKGNSMTSLSTNTTSSPKAATFQGKASIQDITNPLNPVSVDGNATLKVTMSDYGEPGSSDKIGITVWNKSGGTWFSSKWSGTATLEQPLDGGNLVVR